MNAFQKFCEALRAVDPKDRKALTAAIGVSLKPRARASYLRGNGAEAYLALCAAFGINPVTGQEREPVFRSIQFEWWLLGAALYLTLFGRELTLKAASKEIGVSVYALSKLQNGQPVSVETMLKVCKFIGVPPQGYVVPKNVSRVDAGPNALVSQRAAA